MTRTTNKDRVAAVNLNGMDSAELTALSRRALAARKALNESGRKTRQTAKAARLAEKKAKLEAQLAAIKV